MNDELNVNENFSGETLNAEVAETIPASDEIIFSPNQVIDGDPNNAIIKYAIGLAAGVITGIGTYVVCKKTNAITKFKDGIKDQVEHRKIKKEQREVLKESRAKDKEKIRKLKAKYKEELDAIKHPKKESEKENIEDIKDIKELKKSK